MTGAEQRQAAKAFADFWKDKGNERGQSQPFWLSLLRDVFGVEHPEAYIEFEDNAHIDAKHGFIDGYIPSTRVMVEQKSIGKSLRSGIVQADGSILTPFQQAKRYCLDLPLSRSPRWIVTCNFEEFLVYDRERPNADPESILLADLPNEYYRLSFLVQTEADYIKREEEISKQAGVIVGKVYDAFLKQYVDPNNPDTLESLNQLCVRLVFLWYCEDAEVFTHNQFGNYLKRFPARDARRALIDLFKVLNTPPDKRDKYLDPDLAAFPYTNGGLFARDDLEIPQLTDELVEMIVDEGSGFDWRGISPTIFGGIFESTLNPETRRQGGMVFTSLANIHKVIDPLFLNRLTKELDRIKDEPDPRKRAQQAEAFIVKMSSMTFLDPASGSANFLSESYICLRRLENRALAIKFDALRKAGYVQSELNFGEGFTIRVSIKQFHGIEINGFAHAVGLSSMFIAELQMLRETETLFSKVLPSLPLPNYDGIQQGNALLMDWATLASHFDFIFGNPPFVGARMMSQGSEQKREIENLFGDIKDVQDLDYVCGWFKKAAQLIEGTDTRVAFVATNSICQGAQIPILWGDLIGKHHVHIHFAHQSFRWNNESTEQAAVHCVIVGFGFKDTTAKALYSASGPFKIVGNISPYLLEGPDMFVAAEKSALCDVPKMNFGNQPRDGGNLILSTEEKDSLIVDDPTAERWIRNYVGAEELIHGTPRFCLWLKGASPAQISANKSIFNRVNAVRIFRESSKAKTTRGYAKVPHLFAQITQPDEATYLIVPSTTSDKRRYIPIGFADSRTIASNANLIVPFATLYHFGVLTSNVHMAWMRIVAGRLGMGYRYSKELVYNTFPWPESSDEQKARIEKTAQEILDARSTYPDSCLADLYDETLMPPELRKAHQDNDRAVMAAYGFPKGMTESECVAALFERYQALVAKKAP